VSDIAVTMAQFIVRKNHEKKCRFMEYSILILCMRVWGRKLKRNAANSKNLKIAKTVVILPVRKKTLKKHFSQ
jgi:hypothetical protein